MNLNQPREDYNSAVLAVAPVQKPIPLALVGLMFSLLDACVITLVTAIAGACYYEFAINGEFFDILHVELGIIIAFFTVAASALQGSYRPEELHTIAKHPDRLAMAILFGLVTTVLLLFAAKKSIEYSRLVVLVSGALSFLVLLLAHRSAAIRLAVMTRQGRVDVPRLIIIGTQPLVAEFSASSATRTAPYKVVATAEIGAEPNDPRFEAALASARREAQTRHAESIVLCLPWAERRTIEAYLERLADLPATIYLAHDQTLRKLIGLLSPVDAGSLGHVLVRRPLSYSQLLIKRLFDLVGASIGIMLLAPLFAVIAVLIKLDSKGPVFFRQKRYGYNRVPFSVFKFRTMTAESSKEGFRQATRNDARVTRVGRYLRKGSIDELPQLFNVLLGQMSLVGPRPHPIELDDLYTPLIPHYATRHKIQPGITGWAQVNGHRGETESTERMEERIAHDLWYLNHWSLWLDIKILFMTVVSLSSHRNAF